MYIGRRTIKFRGNNYFIKVYTYFNGTMHLKYENSNESHDITLKIENLYLDFDKVVIDPFIEEIGLFKKLKKARIIREICGSYTYNNREVPIVRINMGILRQYDFLGVTKHLDGISK